MALIYKVTCKTTGKVYVGQTIRTFEERKREHLKQARLNTKEFSLLHKAIRKYGKEDFDWVVLEECSLEESDDREIFYIEKEKSFVRDGGYNLTLGGLNNFGVSGEFHWLSRREDREDWIEKNRVGENNPNYGKGDAISGENHYLNRMSTEEREEWLNNNLRGENNYQKKLSAEERKDQNWIHKRTKEEIKEWKEKLSGDNNWYHKRLKNDPNFLKSREKIWEKRSETSSNAKFWKITFPDETTSIIVKNLARYVKKEHKDWILNSVGTAVRNKRKYKGYFIELYRGRKIK